MAARSRFKNGKWSESLENFRKLENLSFTQLDVSIAVIVCGKIIYECTGGRDYKRKGEKKNGN